MYLLSLKKMRPSIRFSSLFAILFLEFFHHIFFIIPFFSLFFYSSIRFSSDSHILICIKNRFPYFECNVLFRQLFVSHHHLIHLLCFIILNCYSSFSITIHSIFLPLMRTISILLTLITTI